ncbi:ectoine synthase [Methyloligella sp. 2.7D]|uniref:ectoine synthase n=1 Tax=unclassified Methyloligella TaxID=2625955 RepID=UPI00157DFDD1|nr:ectoine synthase [Methyloligella sp. GL2]QKP76029.1 ectoine synthase [Methyloligella sp. GL2]
MLVIDLEEVRASDRNVVADEWESARMLLKKEGMGFSFHITKLYAGKEIHIHYKNHLESVYVISGEGTIEDLGTGEVHELRPGILYALNNHDRHILRPKTEIVTACVFNPPVTGREVHDETGAYPADTSDEEAPAA